MMDEMDPLDTRQRITGVKGWRGLGKSTEFKAKIKMSPRKILQEIVVETL